MPAERRKLAPQGRVFHKRPPVVANGKEYDLLHHPLRKITQGAKKAKAFEAQKLARKLKQQSEVGDASTAQVSELLDAIRAVSHERVASHALTSYLHSKAALDLRSHERLATDLGKHAAPDDRKIDPISVEGRAENRILASKHTRAALEGAIAALRLSLGLASDAPPAKVAVAKPVKTARTTSKPTAVVTAESSDDGESEASAIEIAPDDERADGVYSGAESDDEDLAPPPPKPSKRPRSPSPAPKAKKAKKAERVEVKGSTFLPSLSAGYTMGESDASDYEGSDDERKNGKGKNRMGQRQRQALWEKQYGESANHLKKQPPSAELGTSDRGRGRGRAVESGRGRGAPAPRGRGEPPARGRGAPTTRGRGAPPAAIPERTSAAVPAGRGEPPVKSKPPVDVHPSWAAAAKRKEAEALAMKPQGKKITFA